MNQQLRCKAIGPESRLLGRHEMTSLLCVSDDCPRGAYSSQHLRLSGAVSPSVLPELTSPSYSCYFCSIFCCYRPRTPRDAFYRIYGKNYHWYIWVMQVPNWTFHVRGFQRKETICSHSLVPLAADLLTETIIFCTTKCIVCTKPPAAHHLRPVWKIGILFLNLQYSFRVKIHNFNFLRIITVFYEK